MYVGDLYRVTHGQPLTFPLFPGRPAQEEKVGTIILNFLDAGYVFHDVRLDGNSGDDFGTLERFVFGHGRYSDHNGSLFQFDLRGEWVFVDQSDSLAAPLRFNFTQRLPEDAPFQIGPGEAFNLTYLDDDRNARLVCATRPEGDSGNPLEPRKRSGCELYVSDELLLSANSQDVGLDRIQAYRGGLAPRSGSPYRRPDTVIGLRVVRPPPSAESGNTAGD